MNPPTSQKEVRKFIGVQNYYRNMWRIQSHKLATFNILTYIKKTFKWTQV